MTSGVVIDAKLVVFSALHTPQSPMAIRALEHIAARGVSLLAPGLWWYEVTSVIRRYRFQGLVTDAIAYAALDLLTVDMGVEQVDAPERSALDWAARLRQKKTPLTVFTWPQRKSRAQSYGRPTGLW
jgi:hypothetical protein